MGKASRLHREAAIAGTEQPFRQPGQSIKPNGQISKKTAAIRRRDFLAGAVLVVVSNITGERGILFKPPTLPAQEDTDPIPTEVKHAD